jgi:hypothetical protein
MHPNIRENTTKPEELLAEIERLRNANTFHHHIKPLPVVHSQRLLDDLFITQSGAQRVIGSQRSPSLQSMLSLSHQHDIPRRKELLR